MLRRVAAGAALTLIGTGALATASASVAPPGSSVPDSSPSSSAPASAAAAMTTTTIAPTTTMDPVAAEEAVVADAAVAARTALVDALISPGDPAAIAGLDEHYLAGGAARQQIDAHIQQLLDAGQRHAAHPDAVDSLAVESVELGGPPPANRAVVTACVVEAAAIYEQSPESSDVAIANTLRAFRAEFTMVSEGGAWKVESAALEQEWPGQTACPVDEEALIAQRVQEIDAISLSAYLDPSAPDLAERLDSIYTEGGETRQVVESDLQVLRDEGWVGRLHPTIPRTITIEQITLLDGPPATRADVIVCIIDPNLLVDPGALPDGSDVIINGEIWAFRSTQHLVFEDGTWKVDAVDTIDEWTGLTSCPEG
jgi:hypothetical protein